MTAWQSIKNRKEQLSLQDEALKIVEGENSYQITLLEENSQMTCSVYKTDQKNEDQIDIEENYGELIGG